MKTLTKYIADGTVLDMIWKWLKSGYMEEGKFIDTISGTQQGGVISPLLSNVYLNELDWALDKEGIKFVRYCDDFLLFAKSKEEIKHTIPYKAVQKNKAFGIESRCFLKGIGGELHKIDSYTRQRLRVCMFHKHPIVRKGMRMNHKWNIAYFCRIKLIPAPWLYYNIMWDYPIEKYIERQTSNNRKKFEKRIERFKNLGKEYYTKARLDAITYSKSLVFN